MISIHEKIVIRRPLHEVFLFVTDERHNRRWMTDIIDTEIMHDSTRQSQPITRTTVRSWGGLKLTTESQIAAVEPDRRFTTIVSGADGRMCSQHEWVFEPVPEGTCLHVKTETVLNGSLVMTSPVYAWQARRTIVRHLRNLKHLLE